MLRFFRNIRQKLIEEDNVRKYIWYAVGEILLVMIGILLALQVNNWNEARILRSKEQDALKQLLIEAQQNVSYLGSFYDSTTDVLELSKNAAEMLSNKKIPIGSDSAFIAGIEALGYYGSVSPFKTTYDEVVQTGIFNSIRNDTIRFSTNLFYSDINGYSETLSYFRQTFDDPSDYALNSYKTLYDPTNQTFIRREINFDELITNVHFITKVNESLRNMIVFHSTRRNLVQSAEFMCNVIARELETECNPRYKRREELN